MNITRTKKCWVCGDKGTGFNYDALSCESCKVFFHRNAPKPERLKCRKEDSCQIDFASRKSCSKCRLSKCLSVGMKWKSAEDAEKRKIQAMVANVSTIRNVLEMDTETKIFTLYESDSVDIFKAQSRRKKYAADLTVIERQLISELQNAMNVFEDESKLELVKEIGSNEDITNFMNLPVHYIKRVVKFCKNMSAFKCLKSDDQLNIMKPFFIELLNVRFMFIYDIEKDGHAILENESGTKAVFLKFEVCSQFNQEAMITNRKLFLKLKDEMQNDATIRDLVIAQLLFKPRENLLDSEFVCYQYYIYCRLLRRYLEHKYKSINQANRKFSTLVRMMEQMEINIGNVKKHFFEAFDVSQLAQILVEMYEL